MSSRFLVFAVCVGLGACGTDPNNDPNNQPNNQNNFNNFNSLNNEQNDCFFRVTVSGAVAESFDYGLSEGCGGSGGDTSAGGGFGIIGTDWNLQYSLDGIEPEELGTFPATVRIRRNEPEEAWVQEDCEATVTENRFVRESNVGKTYLLAGSGSCPADGATADDMSVVSVGEFSFQNELLWSVNL